MRWTRFSLRNYESAGGRPFPERSEELTSPLFFFPEHEEGGEEWTGLFLLSSDPKEVKCHVGVFCALLRTVPTKPSFIFFADGARSRGFSIPF